MRRKIGVAAVVRKRDDERYSAIGSQMEEKKMHFVRETLQQFRATLEEFAKKHRNRINSDPEFRAQFQEMCLSAGVDPLISSKGIWADLLGVGNYYFELSVSIIQICMQTKSQNGGMLRLDELLKLIRLKSAYKQVTKDDVKKSLQKLSILGNGIKIIQIHSIEFVLSVPLELNKDHECLIEIANENTIFENSQHSFITQDMLISQRGWTADRFNIIIRPLLLDGLVWIDDFKGI